MIEASKIREMMPKDAAEKFVENLIDEAVVPAAKSGYLSTVVPKEYRGADGSVLAVKGAYKILDDLGFTIDGMILSWDEKKPASDEDGSMLGMMEVDTDVL